VRPGLVLYGGLLALVVVGGGARLAFFAPHVPTVRVAGVTTARTPPLPPDSFDDEPEAAVFFNGTATAAGRQAIRPLFTQIDDDLLTRSQEEARAGAKVVVWPELGALVLQEDEPAFLEHAESVARAAGIYLDMGLAVILPPSPTLPFAQDAAVVIDPSGTMVAFYQKTHIVPVMETSWQVPGDGRLPVVVTPYGRVATAICYDADFPSTIRQAGQAHADLLLRPTGDWRAMDPLHAQMVTFRAIENGFSLVDQAKDGLAIAVDYEGNVPATADYFTTDPQVLVAAVSMRGVPTLYATLGDWFAWGSLAGLVVLIGLALANGTPAARQ
jgi:apolipoprotein N-acyltransferase